jgi:hypothetical protein
MDENIIKILKNNIDNQKEIMNLLKKIIVLLDKKTIRKEEKNIYKEDIKKILKKNEKISICSEIEKLEVFIKKNNKDCIDLQNNIMSKISYHLTQADLLARKMELGDIFSYSRVKEVLIADKLNHKIAKEYSGADGYNSQNQPVEYKSTIGRTISATYNGISVQSSWEEQEEYLKTKKIGKYPYHYYARFDGMKIVELWEMKAEDVLKILIPKLKYIYNNSLKKKKDPRLGYTISKKTIYEYGKQIF